MTAPFLAAFAIAAGAVALAGALVGVARLLRPRAATAPVPPRTGPVAGVGLYSWHLPALAATLQAPLVLLLLWAVGLRTLAAAGAASLLAPVPGFSALVLGLAYAWRRGALDMGPTRGGAARDPGDGTC